MHSVLLVIKVEFAKILLRASVIRVLLMPALVQFLGLYMQKMWEIIEICIFYNYTVNFIKESYSG